MTEAGVSHLYVRECLRYVLLDGVDGLDHVVGWRGGRGEPVAGSGQVLGHRGAGGQQDGVLGGTGAGRGGRGAGRGHALG